MPSDKIPVSASVSPHPLTLPVLAPHSVPQKLSSSGDDEAGSSSSQHMTGVEENGFIVKSEPFDPSYEMGDLLLNGSVDSIMDMPLFHEVDSLMNIKHEDHLNDTIFYLPMSYPLDAGVKVEVDTVQQVAEATRTLANELAMPNALVYVTPDASCNKQVTSQQQLGGSVKCDLSEDGSAELRAHLNASPMGEGLSDIAATVNGTILTNGHAAVGKISHDSHMVNGHTSVERGGSGKSGNSKRGGKKSSSSVLDKDNELPGSRPAKKVNGIRNCSSSSSGLCKNSNRQTSSQSTSSVSDSDSSSAEDEENSRSNSPQSGVLPVGTPHGENGSEGDPLGPAVQQALVDDRPEIDRFVICSDHTMECVLCAFTTDSYSAFKSHIICSHPCWRITKKLSKNRLLVERSIKTNTSSLFGGGGGGGSLPLDHSELRTTKGSTTTGSTLHAKNDQELQKVLRKYDKNPRKRQLFERNKRLFKCTICLRLFVFEGSVVNHVTDQHGLARPYDHIHISNDHGQKFGPIYRCNQKNCYFSCESEHELERHSLERHTQVMYRCQLCGYTADSAEAVRNHGLCMHQQQLMCFDTAL